MNFKKRFGNVEFGQMCPTFSSIFNLCRICWVLTSTSLSLLRRWVFRHICDTGIHGTNVTLGLLSRMWHWDFRLADGLVDERFAAWCPFVRFFDLCPLPLDISTATWIFRASYPTPPSPLLNPTRPNLPRVQFSAVDSVQFRWLTPAQLVCFCCAVVCGVALCGVLLCFAVLLFCCFVVFCCVVLCCSLFYQLFPYRTLFEIKIGWLSGVEVLCAFRGLASAGRRCRAAVAAVAESLPDAGVTRWAARRWTKRAISFRSGSKANPDESTFGSRRLILQNFAKFEFFLNVVEFFLNVVEFFFWFSNCPNFLTFSSC